MARSRTPAAAAIRLAPVVALLVAASSIAAPGARSFKSGPIQTSADGRWVWVCNPDNDSVARIDTANDSVVEYALPGPGPHAPHGVSVKEDGSEAWVACRDSDKVFVLRGSDGAVLASIDLPWGSGPYGIAISRDQKSALVTLHRAPGIAVLDVTLHSLRKVLPTYHYYTPIGVAWTEDGTSAWVNHMLAIEMSGDPFLSRIEVTPTDAYETTKIRFTPAGPGDNSSLPPPCQISEGGYLNFRGHFAQIPSVSGKQEMWIPTQYENFHPNPFTPDSTMQATIRHLDLATRTMPNTLQDKVILSAVCVHDPQTGNYVGPGWNAHASGLIDEGFTSDGAIGYMLCEQSEKVIVVPKDTPAANTTGAPPLVEISVGSRPIGLAMSPTTTRAYVCNQLTRDVSVIDLATQTQIKRIATTPLTGEKYSPSVLLGAKIFHSSVDPRISANQKIACASCHPNGEHDGRHWAFFQLPGNHGGRRTMSLLGIGKTFTPGQRDPINNLWGLLHLSGDRDELQDFDYSFQAPTMGGTGFLGAAANGELGPPNAGLSPELDALSDYIRSLPAPPRSPYRGANGALSESAIRGATYFNGSNYPAKKADSSCGTCHQPANAFQDFTSHDIGWRANNEEELNNRTPQWTVNTPSLVGAWALPPYEAGNYYGSNDIVDALVEMKTAGFHGTTMQLLGRQMRDLANFVLSIDGNMTPAEALNARDTVPPRIDKVEIASLKMIDVWFSEAVDAASAGNPASYQILDLDTGQPVAVTAAQWDGQNGDLVRLTTQLPGSSTSFRVSPSPGAAIKDLADWATGGTANVLVSGDPGNAHTVTLGTTLTVTLGGSGYETFTVPVHDCAALGNTTWEHDTLWLWNARGFLRWDWAAAFKAATGMSDSSDIADASFSLDGDWGNAETLEFRRILLNWSDPSTGGDWNSNPVGGPTWECHVHPNLRWNQGNASKRTSGIDGRSASDYDGANDIANTADAVVTVKAMNERTTIGGASVTDAFRFWFDNPTKDYGYAIEQQTTGGSTIDVRFWRSEALLHERGPVVALTYKVRCLVVAPASLPNGTVGVPYSQTLTPQGGVAPYTLSVTGGALPLGLTLSPAGVISGTPAFAATFGATISATDAVGCTGTQDYIITIAGGAGGGENVVAGEGLGATNPNRVRVYLADGTPTPVDFFAYGASSWGTNVAGGNVSGAARSQIVTGPGPGPVLGPQVRAFLYDGTSMGKVNFYAYGTLRYGVNATTAGVDGDAYDEILSGAGPGAVFGPHVRGWNFDNAALTAIGKISFFAYGTLKFGVNVASGGVDADAYAEILTAPGPGVVFGPQVRAFNYDASAVSAIGKINFMAFATQQYGANVAGGQVDGDGFDEILASPGPGPGPSFPARFAGFDYDGSSISALPGFDVTAPAGTTYGGRVGSGDLTGDGIEELVSGAGRDPAAASIVRPFLYLGGTMTPLVTFDPFIGSAYGVNPTAGALGY
ncbi:MAG: putative Ig domain-containing protein [Acidobacteriota bacterium]